MIFAIEGLDRVGKTTLYNALKALVTDAVFVSAGNTDVRLAPVMELVEKLTVNLWASFYDEDVVYIAERCPFVTNPVYAKVFGREIPDYTPWFKEVRVLYLDSASSDRRASTDPWPQDREKTRAAYKHHLQNFVCEYIDTDAQLFVQYLRAVKFMREQLERR